jgi:hypothetical protein
VRDTYGSWLIVLACIPALRLVWSLAFIFANRMRFPAALEWCEEGQLLHPYRLLHGMPLYVPPNHGFMPYTYPPGHFLLLAAVGAVFGLDYGPSRALSIVSFAATAVLLGREVYREFRPVGFPLAWAILAIGSMAAAFPITTGWFDLVRNDSVLFVLVVGAAIQVHDAVHMSRRRFFALAALLTFSFYTKQTAVFYIAWILLFELFRHPRRAIALGFTIAAMTGAVLAYLQWTSDGAYLYYTVKVLSTQQVFKERYAEAWRAWTDFAPWLPVLPAALGVLWWFNLVSTRGLLWSGMLGVAFPAGMLPFAKQGGWFNNLMPVAILVGPASLCLLGGLLSRAPRSAPFTKAMALLAAAVVGFYLDARGIREQDFLVSSERWSAATRLGRYYASLGGSVLDLHHPFFALRSGSTIQEQVHEMPWADLWLAGVPNLNFRPFLKETSPKYVVFSGMEIPAIRDAVADDYVLDHPFPEEMLAPPITGFPSASRYLLVRRSVSPSRRCLFDFESGGYAGWDRTGNAFDSGPQGRWLTDRDVLIGIEGHWAATSRRRYSDTVTGVLTSPVFTITEPRLSLLVGGSDHPGVRVELVAGDEVVRTARGRRVDMVEQVTWDVASVLGRPARIRLVDEDPTEGEHLFVDSVCLEPTP